MLNICHIEQYLSVLKEGEKRKKLKNATNVHEHFMYTSGPGAIKSRRSLLISVLLFHKEYKVGNVATIDASKE